MNKQVVFVNTINFSADEKKMPMGILSLATLLEKKNIPVEIIDFDHLFRTEEIKFHDTLESNLEEMVRHILSFKPEVVSLYTMCNSYPVMIKLAEKLKSNQKDIKIILGGPQASITAKESLEAFSFVDAIGIGEGETYIVEMIEKVIDDQPLDKVNSVAWRSEKGVVINQEAELIKNLDELPMFNYSLADSDSFGGGMSIEVGRGCPFNCTFCSTSLFWKRNCRLKSIERIINEIKYLKEKYNVGRFTLNHDMFTANKEYIIQFCKELMGQDLNIAWNCSARIDTLDREIIEYMSKAGCERIYIGIETGSARMQKILSKNINTEEVVNKLLIVREFNIKPTISFIYGFYEEEENDFRETVAMIEKLLRSGLRYIQLHKFAPLPGTKEFDKVVDQLYYDSIGSDMSRSSFSGGVESLISAHKSIFSSFYNFSTDIRTNFVNMDFFISTLVFGFMNYKKTFHEFLFKDKDIIQLYDEFYDIIEACCLKESAVEKSKQLFQEQDYNLYFECIEGIMERTFNMEKNERYSHIYGFEKDLFHMSSSEDNTTVEKRYPLDILKVLDGSLSVKDAKEESTLIQFRKISDTKIRAKRIKCNKAT